MKMPFGKHKGTDLEDVPEDYLMWVLDRCDAAGPTLKQAIRQILGLEPEQEQARPPPPPGVPLGRVRAMVMEAVKKWHRTQATRNHPDRGGNVQVMQAINAVADELTREITAVFDAAGT